MKKTFIFVFTLGLVLTACFTNDSLNKSKSIESLMEEGVSLRNYYDKLCTNILDAIKYPEPWTKEASESFVISDEAIHSMSTCGLLETLLEYPINKMGPWCVICSNSNLPGVTMYNDALLTNNVAVELFARDDLFSVLASRYLIIIKEKKEHSGQIAYFEMLAASDMCMSVLDAREKIMLMEMALEKMGNKKDYVVETRHIMAAILRACNYYPFLKDVGTSWEEFTNGYHICQTDVVEKHAKQFLNDKK